MHRSGPETNEIKNIPAAIDLAGRCEGAENENKRITEAEEGTLGEICQAHPDILPTDPRDVPGINNLENNCNTELASNQENHSQTCNECGVDFLNLANNLRENPPRPQEKLDQGTNVNSGTVKEVDVPVLTAATSNLDTITGTRVQEAEGSLFLGGNT